MTVKSLLQYFQFPIWIANSHGNGVSIKERFVQRYYCHFSRYFSFASKQIFETLFAGAACFKYICHCSIVRWKFGWLYRQRFSTLFGADKAKGISFFNWHCQHIIYNVVTLEVYLFEKFIEKKCWYPTTYHSMVTWFAENLRQNTIYFHSLNMLNLYFVHFYWIIFHCWAKPFGEVEFLFFIYRKAYNNPSSIERMFFRRIHAYFTGIKSYSNSAVIPFQWEHIKMNWIGIVFFFFSRHYIFDDSDRWKTDHKHDIFESLIDNPFLYCLFILKNESKNILHLAFYKTHKKCWAHKIMLPVWSHHFQPNERI